MPENKKAHNETQKEIERLTVITLRNEKMFLPEIMEAMLQLSDIYQNGILGELEADQEKADYWFQKYTKEKVNDLKERASDGNLSAMLQLAEMYDQKLGGEIEKDIKEDQANYWRSIYNARNGDYRLGTQDITETSPAKMFPFLAKAAEKGNTDAMVKIGLMYRDSMVAQINYWNAADVIELFEDAMAGNPKAMLSMAEMFYYGYNTKEDEVKAYHWLKKAADLDYIPAILQLAELQNSGIEIDEENHNREGSDDPFHIPEENYKKAMYWFKKAAALNNVEAIYNVGLLYDNGENWGGDSTTDSDECSLFLARKWYTKAVSLGHKDAEEMLEKLLVDMEDSELI